MTATIANDPKALGEAILHIQEIAGAQLVALALYGDGLGSVVLSDSLDHGDDKSIYALYSPRLGNTTEMAIWLAASLPAFMAQRATQQAAIRTWHIAPDCSAPAAQLVCPQCGTVDLPVEEYARQLADKSHAWVCPRCGTIACTSPVAPHPVAEFVDVA